MPGLQEYVIRLSADVDNTGVSKIMSLLDTNKMKALGLTAALTAATTAVYKFIESAAKKEIELNNLAKKQKKSIEDTRAQKEALDQMGMSLNDIKKDAALKSIYDDLVKFNKEMEIPNASGAIAKVRLLQGAFWKLKSAVSYVVQRVGLQMLENLEQPMDRFTSKLNKISDWIRDNFTSITTKISKAMTGFSKGIITIVEGVEKVLEFINKIPDGVKGVATAIAALFAIIKSGPIGWLLAAVTAIGDIVHDFENYQYNKENGLKKGDEGYVENLNDLIGIWDAVDDANKSGLEKAGTIGTLLLTAISNGIKNIPAEELGKEIGNFVNEIFTKITEAITGTGDGDNMISALTGLAESIVTGLMSFFTAAFNAVDYPVIKDSIEAVIGKIFDWIIQGISSLADFTTTIKDSVNQQENGENVILTLTKSIVESIKKGFEKLKGDPSGVIGDINTIVSNLFSLITTGISSALKLVLGEEKENGEYEKGLIGYGVEFAQNVLKFIAEGAKKITSSGVSEEIGATIGELISGIFKSIGDFLSNSGEDFADLLGNGFEAVTNVAQSLLKVILSGIKSLGAPDEEGKSGIQRFVKGIFDFISDTIKGLSDKIDSGELNLEETFGDIGTTIGEIIGSTIEIAVDFIGEFINNASDWIAKNHDRIANIGRSIAQAIIEGFASMFSAMFMRLILGNEGYDYYKSNEKKPANVTEGDNGNVTIEQGGLTENRTFESEEEKQDYVKKVEEKGLMNTWREEARETPYLIGPKVRVVSSEYDNKTNEYLSGVNNAETGFMGPENGLYTGDWQGSVFGTDAWNSIRNIVDMHIFEKEGKGERLSPEEELVDKALDSIQAAGAAGKEISAEDYKTILDYATAHQEELGLIIHTVSSELSTAASALSESMTEALSNAKKGEDGSYTISSEDASKLGEDAASITANILSQLKAANVDLSGLSINTGEDGAIKITADSTEAQKTLDSFIQKANQTVTVKVKAEPEGESGGTSTVPEAMGGRFDKPFEARVAEAGPEYIIPITKGARAIYLAIQMLQELGRDAFKRIASALGYGGEGEEEGFQAGGLIRDLASGISKKAKGDFSLGTAGTIGGSLGGIENALQNMQQNFTYNISAPVSIQVQSSGASAEEIGTKAYDLAERHLLKTLRGAYA